MHSFAFFLLSTFCVKMLKMLINKRDLSIFRKTFVFKVTACKMLKILILHSAIIQRSTFSQASLILSLFKFIISQSPLCCLVPFVPFTAFFNHGIPQPFSVPVYHIMEFDVLSCFICLISSQLSVFAQLFSVHSDAIDRIMIRRI